MLILWLYGEWRLFRNAYEWEVSMFSDVGHLYHRPDKAEASLIQFCSINKCNRYNLAHSQCLLYKSAYNCSLSVTVKN